MRNKPVAIVLGGTYPQIKLIKHLQYRGYFVILIDYYEDPPARGEADEHVQESTLDKDKVLQIARDRKASLVISTCIDQANVTACYVAEILGLPAPYSYRAALNVSNKALMKEIMVGNNIPTSRFIRVRDLDDYENNLRLPLIVKPADSNSSKGVRKVLYIDELAPFLEGAMNMSRNGEAIIEEFKTGREIGLDCFIKDNRASILMTRERKKIDLDDQVQQIFGSVWPASLTEEQLYVM